MSYHSDYLDDIREYLVGNRSVLAVKSALRKRVKGQFLGTSKTGSLRLLSQKVYKILVANGKN